MDFLAFAFSFLWPIVAMCLIFSLGFLVGAAWNSIMGGDHAD